MRSSTATLGTIVIAVLACGGERPAQSTDSVATTSPTVQASPPVPTSPQSLKPELEPYTLGPIPYGDSEVPPSYLVGRFDGDSLADSATLVRTKGTGKLGILIQRGSGAPSILLGAGNRLGNSEDQLSGMIMWDVVSTATPGVDGILIAKNRVVGGLIKWSGTRFEWIPDGG